MGYKYQTDGELDRSTNRVMALGGVLMLLMVLAFPFYRLYEPNAREAARETHIESLVSQGSSIWEFNCSSCHGVNGEGVTAPALNSQQFLQSATNEQIEGLVAVGVPGTQMSAYSLDFGGPLTLEQIKAVVTFIRSWEPDAPDREDWREPAG
jgi:mono/diheme cytochrome c family protein